jgi:alpha-galactosidase
VTVRINHRCRIGIRAAIGALALGLWFGAVNAFGAATNSRPPEIASPLTTARPEIHPPCLVGARVGRPLFWKVPATGARPLSFSSADLPPELSIDSTNGILTGTLSKSGDYLFHVRAKNRAGQDEQALHVVAGDRLALTPPMGWNSYDCFGDNVTESEVLTNAQYVAQKLQPFGWDLVVVDYRWYDPEAHDNNANARTNAALTMDRFGRLVPAPNRFPSAANGNGFRPLADAIHSLGLRFGIHIMRGVPRLACKSLLPIEGTSFTAADAADPADLCPWCPDMFGVRAKSEAGQAYYDSLLRLYAAWQGGFIKLDDASSPYHREEIEAVHRAIDQCGRAIILSLSPGETPLNEGAHAAEHANLWRVSGDFWDEWKSLEHEFTLAEQWVSSAAPGHWPDADMLPLGRLSVNGRSVGPQRFSRFTWEEQVTLMSLWAILPSPLMVGAHLPDNGAWTLALLTNPEVLAVNQDGLGVPAARVFQKDNTEVWTRPLTDGSLVVGLFNRGNAEQRISVNWSALGIGGRHLVRDLWLRKGLGRFDQAYACQVRSHGASLLRLTKSQR